MFNSLGFGELLMLLLLGLLIFGPEQLPKIAGDLGRMIRQLRKMATDASADLRSELGPEFDDVDLASLNPRKFIERHILSDDLDEPAPKARARREAGATSASPQASAPQVATPQAATAHEAAVPETPAEPAPQAAPAPYDVDAT